MSADFTLFYHFNAPFLSFQRVTLESGKKEPVSSTLVYEYCNLQIIYAADDVIPVLDTGIQTLIIILVNKYNR
ncbi:MAG: hypothetical protein ACR5LA_04775 [Wolbachia sp.]